ncbi:phosphoglycerate mutase-like protein [Dendrothele bispora CBS 962.96]|uniref:Phosphoglycerate mutase-like protein n=1 Tax=Dendrothele bispora (strain CBS 962.96) TaxID=1314807 RepID=A0A4S8MPI5_DENBC|nr:phosphoglycerate mutase-like protein [Dendrothele bispora CBS 962.96]
MIETIYIARHGFRLNWVTTTWKSETGLARDPPLAAFGVTQAEELATYFSSLPEDQRPTAIFSSPYYRCLQTAKPTSIALNIPIYVEHGLSEWYSPVAPNTGLHPRPGSASSLKAFFPQIDPEGWSSVYYPTRRGEDVQGLHDRMNDFLSHFVPHAEKKLPVEKHKRILFVSHAASIIVLARELLGKRNLGLRVGCCSLSEFVKKPDENSNVLGGWEPKRLAEAEFLTGGVQRDWGLEDIEIADGKVVNDSGEPGTENEADEPVGPQVRMISSL